MAALTKFTDGLHNFGSVVLSIGTFTAGGSPSISSGVSYVADNFTINRPSKTVEQSNQIDTPSGQLSYDTFITGSAQVQLAAAATLAPLKYKAFELQIYDTDNDGDITSDKEWFYIDSVETPFTKDQEVKVNITFRKIINTASAVAS